MIATVLYAVVHHKMSAHKDLDIPERITILDRIHSQPKGTSDRQLRKLLKLLHCHDSKLEGLYLGCYPLVS